MPSSFPLVHATTGRDLRFHALRDGSRIGEHRAAFRMDGDRLTVETHIDIAVTALFFTVFRFRQDARDAWQSGRLASVTSEAEHDGTRLKVSGNAVENGVFYDSDQRWVKALIELKGETIEYALAT